MGHKNFSSLPYQQLESRLPTAFVAGFLGVLIFHQLMLAALHGLGLTALTPYAMGATAPFAVPRVLSLAFWGGLWAMPLALILARMHSRYGYWLTAVLFGAIGPSVVNWLVVMPIKDMPMGGGWHPSGILTALIINGSWGLGTALILYWASRRSSQMHPHLPVH
jgi:hypothetical protein